MPIPQFNQRGTLDNGIHKCNSSEFIDRFCYGDRTIRSKYKEVLQQLFAFCINRGGESIIIGGSFVTTKEEPNDLDCMLIVPNEKCCTMLMNELLCVEGCEMDILVLAESSKDSIYAFLNLLSKDQFEIEVGIVEIFLDEEKDKSSWHDYGEYYSLEKLLESREAYINRHVIRGSNKRKVLVTVMAPDEYLLLNYEISPLVSNAGWIFAPHVFKGKDIENVYINFKIWITDLYYQYDTEISVFADGIGTYLLGMYLKDNSKKAKAKFDKIILSNALLSSDFDWIQEIENMNIKLIVNLKDVNNKSTVMKKVPRSLRKSSLWGTSYKTGFNSSNEKILEQNHNYKTKIDYIEFQNSIFPLFHMSGMIKENIEKICWENLQEISEKIISLGQINVDLK